MGIGQTKVVVKKTQPATLQLDKQLKRQSTEEEIFRKLRSDDYYTIMDNGD